MKRFEVQARRADLYEIEIDPTIVDQAFLEDYSKSFSEVNDIQELSEHLAGAIITRGSGSFFEGFGYVKTFRNNGTEIIQHKNGNIIPSDQFAEGITIRLISEDQQYEFETYEIIKSLDS